MKTLSTFLVMLWTVAAFATILPSSERPLSDHLIEVNSEWITHLGMNPRFDVPVHFTSENARIQRHLLEVCDLIDRNTASSNIGEKSKIRYSLTQQLRAYANEGSFPVNSYSSDRNPYFIDRNGTACAVGYLMLENGFDAEAMKVHEEINDAYLREIPGEWLAGWVDFSGLSLDELALIQPGYPPNTVWDNLGASIEGTVYAMLPWEDELLIAGDFSINGVDYNIASFDGTSINHWPGSLSGPVRDLIAFDGKIYACGAFEGLQRDIAVWENDTWTYSNAILGKSSEGYDLLEKDGQLYCATSASGFAGYDYWVMRLIDGEWEQLAVFDGKVDCLYSFDNELVAAGEFQIIYTDDGEAPMNYVAIMNEDLEWREAGTGMNAPVYALSEFENQLVASGQLLDSEAEPANYGRLLVEGIWSEPFDLGLSPDEEEVFAVQDMVLNEGSYYFVGNFYLYGFGNFGADVAEVQFIDYGMGTYYPASFMHLTASAGTVYKCEFWNGNLYIAGDFDAGILGPRKFARTDLANVVPETESLSIEIFPNPTSSVLNVRIPEGWTGAEYILSNTNGKRIKQGRINGIALKSLDLEGLPAGIYMLELMASPNGPKASARVVLN